MKYRMKIIFDSDHARTIHRTISPDNTPLPRGIRVDSKVKENKIEITVECDKGIKSLWATVEDIMSAIDVSLRTLQELDV
ncbi:MAG: KEOPS complex subunit Pcc1 [Candidatus Thorarchaeota archaeon]